MYVIVTFYVTHLKVKFILFRSKYTIVFFKEKKISILTNLFPKFRTPNINS